MIVVLDRYSTQEKRRLLFGSVLFALGSLVLGISRLPTAGTMELVVTVAGVVVFGGVAVGLALDIARD